MPRLKKNPQRVASETPDVRVAARSWARATHGRNARSASAQTAVKRSRIRSRKEIVFFMIVRAIRAHSRPHRPGVRVESRPSARQSNVAGLFAYRSG